VNAPRLLPFIGWDGGKERESSHTAIQIPQNPLEYYDLEIRQKDSLNGVHTQEPGILFPVLTIITLHGKEF